MSKVLTQRDANHQPLDHQTQIFQCFLVINTLSCRLLNNELLLYNYGIGERFIEPSGRRNIYQHSIESLH